MIREKLDTVTSREWEEHVLVKVVLDFVITASESIIHFYISTLKILLTMNNEVSAQALLSTA